MMVLALCPKNPNASTTILGSSTKAYLKKHLRASNAGGAPAYRDGADRVGAGQRAGTVVVVTGICLIRHRDPFEVSSPFAPILPSFTR